jgi:predicted RNA-binding protein with PUA-like domain
MEDMMNYWLFKSEPDAFSIDDLRTVKTLGKMALLRKGNRLSIQPVSEKEWATGRCT